MFSILYTNELNAFVEWKRIIYLKICYGYLWPQFRTWQKVFGFHLCQKHYVNLKCDEVIQNFIWAMVGDWQERVALKMNVRRRSDFMRLKCYWAKQGKRNLSSSTIFSKTIFSMGLVGKWKTENQKFNQLVDLADSLSFDEKQ